TPNLDRFAAEAVRYTQAFANAPVCAPARSCLITGMYPPSLGSHHMRSTITLPEGVRCFTACLRDAGYYCTNHTKTDYNFPPPDDAWDDSSNRAHWRNRAAGQPFFAVFNLTVTHESQIRTSEENYRQRTKQFTDAMFHDPARAPVPPFHPDTPIVRRDWARYYDNITAMDIEARDILDQLEADGLAEDTIVFFYSDHGAGMTRCKRWPYDSGLHVPLMVRFPERYAQLAPTPPGGAVERLVSFPDFGATVLSLAGVPVPKHIQGVPFLGAQAGPEREYVYAARDRMDERYDMMRAVRDRRYKYIRQFLPHLPYAQPVVYGELMPTMQEWRRLAAEGALQGAPALFMRARKPLEELYDLENDPFELDNLAEAPEHRETLERMRARLESWVLETRDLGFLPEADMHARAAGRTFRELGRDEATYPLSRILETAQLPLHRPDAVPELLARVEDTDPTVRYWAVVGLTALGTDTEAVRAALAARLADAAPDTRLAAADALRQLGEVAAALPVLLAALDSENEWVRLRAANIADRVTDPPASLRDALDKHRDDPNQYVARVAKGSVE
ncbi:MAG TPA: sulfatase, partial [Candidatus Hydrogenedentes bacterium]|nr:sulfatase [Candidatus Hydrogenedentota bacterium]